MKNNSAQPSPRILLLSDSTELPYTVRESHKAKNVLLKLRRRRGLEVVVPVGFDWGLLPGVLQKKLGWIERSVAQRPAEPQEDPPLPRSIPLRALNQTLQAGYRHRPGRRPVLRWNQWQITITGDLDDTHACRRLLRSHLKALARQHLPPWLDRLARRHGLFPTRCTIRLQKTRWGSCSAKGGVSLNAKLLLLPPELAEYVLLHELAHLRHPDHSPAYWNLVGSLAPEFRDREAELRQAWTCVPAWAEAD
jgi:hypothetical protein